MCLREDKRLANIPLESIHLAITTHSRRKFVKRFPAPQAPTDLDEYLRWQVRQSTFLAYSKEAGKAIYGNKHWIFVLALNRRFEGFMEAVIISCWGNGSNDVDTRYLKQKVYRRTRENRRWRQEECVV